MGFFDEYGSNVITISYDYLESKLEEYYKKKYPNNEIEYICWKETDDWSDEDGWHGTEIILHGELAIFSKLDILGTTHEVVKKISFDDDAVEKDFIKMLNEYFKENGDLYKVKAVDFKKEQVFIAFDEKTKSKTKKKEIILK